METKLKKLIDEKYGSVDKLMSEHAFSITRQQLYRVVNGKTNTTINVAYQLAQALGVSLTDMYFLIVEAQETGGKN